jgi:hypothetical protein
MSPSHNEREVSLGDISSIDENEVDEKIRNLALYNPKKPKVPPDHQVVTRLSRWEGGNAFDKELFNKPSRGKLDEEVRNQSDRGSSAADNPTLTIRDVVKVFVRSDSLLIVEDEDIERVKLKHDTFLESSQFSFNYNVMLGVASILAGKFHVFAILDTPSLSPSTQTHISFVSLLRDRSFGTWSVQFDAVFRRALLIKSCGCLVKSHILWFFSSTDRIQLRRDDYRFDAGLTSYGTCGRYVVGYGWFLGIEAYWLSGLVCLFLTLAFASLRIW